jgi:hypothetical protein
LQISVAREMIALPAYQAISGPLFLVLLISIKLLKRQTAEPLRDYVRVRVLMFGVFRFKRVFMQRDTTRISALVGSIVIWFNGAAFGQTIINVPPSPSPTSAGADTIVNVLPGGTLEDSFQVLNGGLLNIDGGSASTFTSNTGGMATVHNGTVFRASAQLGGIVNILNGNFNYLNADSATLNIHGGNVIDVVDANDSSVKVWGGSFTDNFRARNNSELTIYGREFHLNGTPIDGLNAPGESKLIGIDPADQSYLSGVFADGIPFVFGGQVEAFASMVRLVLSEPYLAGPSEFNVASSSALAGVHAGQTLNLLEGGSLPRNFTAGQGSTIHIHGGSVGPNFDAVGANINATGGTINDIDAYSGTVVNIGGTTEWNTLEVYGGATANINGGAYTSANGGNFFEVHPGGVVNLSAGTLDGIFSANNATVNISGGSVSYYQLASKIVNKSNLAISGGSVDELEVISGSTVTMTGGAATRIIASGDNIPNRSRVNVSGGEIESLDAYEFSIATITGGSIDSLDNIDARTDISGGAIGDKVEWLSGTVDIRGYDFQVNGVPVPGLTQTNNIQPFTYTPGTMLTGILADGTPFNLADFDSFPVSIESGVVRLIRSSIPSLPANISVPTNSAPGGIGAGRSLILEDGGALGKNFTAGRNSVVTINGGTVGDNFEAERSQVTINGGALGKELDVFDGAVITMTGGSIGDSFEVHSGGTLNIQGGNAGRQGKGKGGTIHVAGGKLSSGFEALAGTTVNISSGEVESNFTARAGSHVSVSEGSININFNIYQGATADISGGSLRELEVQSGGLANVSGGNLDSVSTTNAAQLHISGGSFGDGIYIHGSSISSLSGTQFKVGGVPIAGLNAPGNEVFFVLPGNQLFTGIFEDGTPFAFQTLEGDTINNVKLIRSGDLPNPSPSVVVPGDAIGGGLRAGQTLTVNMGGVVPKNFTVGEGSVVDVVGGTIGENFEAYGALVNIHDGVIGNNLDAFANSQINIYGGTVGPGVNAYSGATINLEGGEMQGISALAGSQLNLSGGHLDTLTARIGSNTRWDGGTLGVLSAHESSSLGVHGVDFQLDGVPVSGLNAPGDSRQFNFSSTSVLTGTLADGTPMVISPMLLSQAPVPNGVLTLFQTATPPLPMPQSFYVTDQSAPRTVGQRQLITVAPGGQLPSYFLAGAGSSVDIQGGSVLPNFRAFGSQVHITSGGIGINFTALAGTELKIEGGQFGNGFQLTAGSVTSLSGGTFASHVLIQSGAELDIFGKSFLIGGVPISQLTDVGDSFVLSQFNGQFLTATLRDGSVINWRLNQNAYSPRNPNSGIYNGAVVTLHLVPEPTGLLISMVFGTIGCFIRRPILFQTNLRD